MKKFFKNLLYLSTLSALLPASCTDDKTDPPEDEGDFLCEILTFGFYAEDNSGALTLDYTGEIAERVITVRMPEYLDRTALVARFTVTEDDVVKHGETEVKSGVTALDYSRTVELVVSDPVSKLSAVYTVRVLNTLSGKWSTAGRLEQGESALGSFHAMKINPKDGNPYVAYWVQADNGSGGTTRRMAASKFDGSAFSTIGSEGFSGTVANAAVDIALDSDGVPYVLYLDADNSNGPTVMNYSGGSWSLVGDAGFADKANTSNGVAIGINPSTDRPVTVTVQDISGTTARRSPQYAYNTSAGWVADNPFPGRPDVSGSTYMGGYPIVKTHGNSLYMAVNNAGSTADGKANGYSIYKMTGTNVTTVVEGGLVDEGSSTTFMYDTAFDIASDGTIYLVSADDSDGGWKLRVYAFREGDPGPRQIGSPIVVDVTRETKMAVALDKDDVCHVAYCAAETGNLINVISYQMEKRTWSDPVAVGSTPVKSNSGERIYFGFNDANVGYLSATTADTPYAVELYRLDYIE